MAGLGTQNQKSVAPLVRRVQLRSAYIFCACSTQNGPHETEMVHMGFRVRRSIIARLQFTETRYSTGIGASGGQGQWLRHPPIQKPSQIHDACIIPAIQEPKFSVCSIVFDGGCDLRWRWAWLRLPHFFGLKCPTQSHL